MKLKPEQLPQHLKNLGPELLPVYLFSGDEPLLIQEATDQLRQAATAAGFTERARFHADNSFQWERLIDEANSLSLFAEKKIIELYIPNGKPGAQGTEALLHYCQNPSPDNLLLIVTPRLDGSAQKTKWYKTVEQLGSSLTFWPIEIDQLPRWISSRLSQKGMKATPTAAEILAEKVEGNLLAAMQEIEKLELLVTPGQVIDEETILELVADSARYDLFSLMDAALQGNQTRCLKMLRGLQTEGTEPTLLIWALSREIRTLLELKQQNSGTSISEQQFKKHRIWGKRKSYFNRAHQQLSSSNLLKLLSLCNQADHSIKGIEQQSPWLVISHILLGLSQGKDPSVKQFLP